MRRICPAVSAALLALAIAASVIAGTSAEAPSCHAATVQSHKPDDDALTPAEVEEVREETDFPVRRVKLYMRFLDERSAKITQLHTTQLVEQRGTRLHDSITHFLTIADELQNNLDEYESYQTNERRPVPDLRKLLPELQKSVTVWQAAVTALPPDEDYNFVLETTTASLQSLKEQTTEMIASQAKYFAEKKLRDKSAEKDKKPGGYVLP